MRYPFKRGTNVCGKKFDCRLSNYFSLFSVDNAFYNELVSLFSRFITFDGNESIACLHAWVLHRHSTLSQGNQRFWTNIIRLNWLLNSIANTICLGTFLTVDPVPLMRRIN